MNKIHLELCSSDEWADALKQWVLPTVLDGLDLGDDVLEVGPGPGRTTEVLAGMTPRLTALELDPALAAQLAERLGGSVEVVRGDATAMDFENDRFSVVLSLTMLHHLPSSDHQDRLFAEAARVLRPGGVFAGTDSRDSKDFRKLHVDDICVPIEPESFPDRLLAAGFVDPVVNSNEHGVRFRAWRAAPTY